jgi:hypothetical protein
MTKSCKDMARKEGKFLITISEDDKKFKIKLDTYHGRKTWLLTVEKWEKGTAEEGWTWNNEDGDYHLSTSSSREVNTSNGKTPWYESDLTYFPDSVIRAAEHLVARMMNLKVFL